MAKKKGAVAAKARAKREAAKNRAASPAAKPRGDDKRPPRVMLEDGCRVQKGLKNNGNTCYMNSMLQCLNVSTPFSDELIGKGPPVASGVTSSLATVFSGIRGVDAPTGGASAAAFDPKPLQQQVVNRFPWFRGKEQQDAHEFLRTLLGAVSDEFEEAKPAQNGSTVEDTVVRLFGGRWCAATLCWNCSSIALRSDPFLDVPLHLPALNPANQVRALGVTEAMATGEEEPPLPAADATDASAEEEEGDGGKSSRKAKGRKGREAPKAAPAQPKAAKPRGVWGAAQERADIEEGTKIYLARLVVRLLEKEAEAEAEAEAVEAVAEEPKVQTVEIELQRSKQKSPQWGFTWSDVKCKEEQFVLCGVVEDSVVERWNLKRRAMGEPEQIICIGDRLLEVNFETEYKTMSRVLRTEDVVQLKFARGAIRPDADLGRGQAESDGEDDRKAEEKAKKDLLRQSFCDAARACYESLPPALAEVFGPEEAHKGPTDKVSLEHCLHQFSTVEALEDDYKPVYNCTGCKEKFGRTYASRRLWLWPASLPPLLTIHLKRFRRYRDRFEKSSASISLPLSLDLGSFVLSEGKLDGLKPYVKWGSDELKGSGGGSLTYELYGICVHQGSTMRSGHYIAFVNSGPSLEKESWFEISDARRRSCSRAEVLKAEAYVAFYRREGTGCTADEAVRAAAAMSAEAAAVASASPSERHEDGPEDDEDERDEEGDGD